MSSDTLALASLSLTHVFYDPSDPISYVCALLALVPQALCIIYVTLIYSSREIELILMFAGQMACELMNWILKRIIQEERPGQLQGRGYGMPSSHSQYVAFFSAYICLFLLIRHVPSKRTSPDSSPATFSQRLIVSVLACAGATLVIYSRVYLRYHTKKQVLVGAALGVGFAIAWFIFTKCLRSLGLLDSVLDCELARLARVRDLMTTEDFAEAGWVRWRQDRERSRREKDVNGNGRKDI